jgi:hypothetical protein
MKAGGQGRKSGGARKIGNSKIKCSKYSSNHTREKNKKRIAEKIKRLEAKREIKQARRAKQQAKKPAGV